MDSILILSPEQQKLERFLTKLGYEVFLPNDQMLLKDIVEGKVLDLILLDTAYETDAVELCDFIRGNDSTKKVPIVCLSTDRAKGYAIRDLAHEKVDLVPAPYSIGSLVAKIATQLRLRKIAGERDVNATLSETNAALRDLNAHFKQEMIQARSIQQNQLPKELPKSPLFEMAVSYAPLEEVGGDWYFIQNQPDGKVGVQMADVTGHGLAAAFVGSMTKLAITAANQMAPHDLLKGVNSLMTPQLPQGTFVTMCSYLYNSKNGDLQFARAGHPPALVLNRANNKVERLSGTGFAVGFFDDSDYSLENAKLEKDDVVIIYTDGITEAQNRSGAQYGIDRLASQLLLVTPEMNAEATLHMIQQDFKVFCEGRILKDDVTILVLKRIA